MFLEEAAAHEEEGQQVGEDHVDHIVAETSSS